MKKMFLSASTALLLAAAVQAQNTSPYWSLAGNSNATVNSKLGTTNGVSLRFYTNNVQRMLIGFSSGNASIGTTSLDARLTVNAASGTNALLGQVNGTTKLRLASNGGLSVGSGATPPSNGLYVAGNVGIGTAAPSSKLYVAGSDPYVTALRVNNGGVRITNEWSTGDSSVGLYAEGGVGVRGNGMNGVYGTGMNGVVGEGYIGVSGRSEGGLAGVEGFSTDGYGVYGTSNNNYAGYFNSNNYRGIYVQSGSGWYAGYFAGDVYATGTFVSSDARLKKNIAGFDGAMALLNKLQPKHYEFQTEGNHGKLNLPKGTHYGLLAQDVEKVLPQLVKDASTNTKLMQPPAKPATSAAAQPQKEAGDAIEFKAVNYTELIPIVVKGMQELDAENKALKEELNALRQLVLELKNGRSGVTAITGTLNPASPNPARGSTRISYTLPQGTSRAQLRLSDASGKTVKVIALNASGVADVSTTGLSSGIYNYSLIVDGKIAETKKLTVAH